MAADKYKIGDRVIVAENWTKGDFWRMNHLRGSIVTIDSICERVWGHNERGKFYRFAEASEAGHFWDDADIAGLAPMLPRPHFELVEGKEVVFLPHDKSNWNHLLPGIITFVSSEYFIVQDKWSHRQFLFHSDDFVCHDKDECNRIVVYENEAAAKRHQNLVRLQCHIQTMFCQFSNRIPTIEDLEQITNIVTASSIIK